MFFISTQRTKNNSFLDRKKAQSELIQFKLETFVISNKHFIILPSTFRHYMCSVDATSLTVQ